MSAKFQKIFLFILIQSCDKLKMGIREVSFSFQGGFSKMYRIYMKNC